MASILRCTIGKLQRNWRRVEVDAEGNALDDDTSRFLFLNRESPSDVAANEAQRRANRLWGSL